MVVFSSSKTFVRISWHEVQNVSVLVSSRAVLKPPQKMMPATNPASTRNPKLKIALGRINTPQISNANESVRRQNEGRGTSVVVIAVLPDRSDSTSCRCRRIHSQPEPAHCAEGRDTRYRNIGGAKPKPGIALRDR